MMKRIMSGICAAAIALSMGGFAAPASAGPPALPTAATPSAKPITNVDFRYRHGGRQLRGHVEQLTGVPRRQWRGRQWRGDRGHWRGRDGRGHRRHWRYRDDNDFIGPAAGFIAGAIIGNVLSQGYSGGGHVRLSRAHVDWCDDRYRSYRLSDNTFQPYHGPRKQCISPYY